MKRKEKEPLINFQEAVRTGQIVRGKVRMTQKKMYEGDEDCLIVEVSGKKVTVLSSEIVLPLNQSLSSLVGSEIDLIITLAPEDVPLIFGSQKAVVAMKQKPLMDKLKEGEVMEGTVVRLLPYGAYVSIGDCGLNGLLRNVDFSNDITTIKDVCRVGEKIGVKLLRISTKGNIYLEAAEKYSSGDIFTIADFTPHQMVFGTVCNIKTFGVFVRIAAGLDALCPNPDFIDDLVEGQKVIVRIKKIEEEENQVRGTIQRVLED